MPKKYNIKTKIDSTKPIMSNRESIETIKSKEPPIHPETRELAEKLELRKQWGQQVKTLNETGIIELLPKSQDIGIVDINGKEQPIPTYEQILESLNNKEQREVIKEKQEQGFTKLLMIPMGLPVSVIIDRYRRLIKSKHEQGNLESTDNEKLELDEETPIYLENPLSDPDIDSQLIYFPEQFNKQDHKGKTKQELIKQNQSWQVMLIEDMPDIPAENKGKTIKNRKQLEANKSPINYLKTTKEQPQYKHEQGPTMESELTYAITQLKEKNQVIDDWQGKGKACWLFGTYLPEQGSSGGVPDLYWYRDYQRARLYWYYPGDYNEHSGARSGVKIFSK